MKSRLARRFAILGLAIGVTVALLWWYVRIFNPFHLPTWQQIAHSSYYSAPLTYWIFQDIVSVLCPGTFLQIFTMEMRGWFSWFMWILAVFLNIPIYYGIGLVVDALMKRRR
jgi:hypothetical protein